MEALTFSAYNFGGHPGYFPVYHDNTKFKPHTWNKKGSFGFMPEIPDYFEMYKRAQLKAILSQVNPNLTPRPRNANTREFGVQVNPKVNVTVQCSLGPKTLFYRDDVGEDWGAGAAKSAPKGSGLPPSTPANTVRFSRPLAVYSPVFDRRFFSVPTRADDLHRNVKVDITGEETCEDEEEEVETRQSEAERAQEGARRCPALQSRAPARFNFQFLEQKYGYYHCSKCNIRWESAYVWCISGTCKVYFKQHCRKCQVGLNPYRVEAIQCQVCGRTRCCCEQKQRHIDIRRPHRQDLCGRCKGKRLSCDTTYSFKYIV